MQVIAIYNNPEEEERGIMQCAKDGWHVFDRFLVHSAFGSVIYANKKKIAVIYER